MSVYKLQTTGWVNLSTLSSLDLTLNSVKLTNLSNSAVYLTRSATIPESSFEGAQVFPKETSSITRDSLQTWIRAPLLGTIDIVLLLSNSIEPFTSVDLPSDVWTSAQEGYRRLRVDSGQTGFFEGREFRTFREFSISAGATLVLRIVVPINAILFEQGVEIDAGSLRITNALGGTPGGTFSEVLTPIGKNNMSTRPTPFYVPQVTWAAGGTHTGGFIFDIHRAVAANATAQQSTVGNIVGDERGVAANTYYVRYENIGSATATGTLWFFYEERP